MPDHDAVPPEAQLMQALFGFMVTRSVSVVAELGVADSLSEGPQYYTELAKAANADRRALHRVMRLLVSTGVFTEPEPGMFALNEVSELLRSDHPQSLRDLAVLLSSKSHWRPWGRLSDTVRSGESGPQHAFGSDIFSWFQNEDNEEEWRIFNAAMTSFSSATSRAVAEAYDFSGFQRICDIGGGHGYLLNAMLAQAPQATGVVFDLPGVVEGADTETLGDRIECVGGDFFEAVPAGADCYTMKHIVHDWSDEHCRILLGNIATAMDPNGRVLLVELVMPDTAEPHPAKFMDINMLAITEGGTERTEAEFAALFESAGLKIRAIHETDSLVCIIEAVKEA